VIFTEKDLFAFAASVPDAGQDEPAAPEEEGQADDDNSQ